MAILKVAQLGTPILRQRSSEVPLDVVQTPDFQRFIDDMVDTMRDYDGVGIAAPQVHKRLRVFAMEVSSNPRYPNKQDYPLTIIINPLITAPDSECIDDWEGCLSVPGMRGFVPRTPAIRVTGMNRRGETINLSLEGFPARIVQHETDHLDGMVYLDRMRNMSTLAFQREYERFHLQAQGTT